MTRPCFRSLVASLSLLLLLAGSGCGGDDSSTPTDAGLGDSAMPPGDGSMPPDGPLPDGGPVSCTPSPQAPAPTITTCAGASLPPPSSGTCTVEAGDQNLLITGDVLTPGEVLRGGQVLVDPTGHITCVDCDCSGTAGASTATKITLPQGRHLAGPHQHPRAHHLRPELAVDDDRRALRAPP